MEAGSGEETKPQTPTERFVDALERRPARGHVPHFELVFFLTMEVFGKVHPSHRLYHQWDQMEESERRLHRIDMAELFIETARRFGHDAILLHPNPNCEEEAMWLVEEPAAVKREAAGGRCSVRGNAVVERAGVNLRSADTFVFDICATRR